jgi:hypothetical protein
MSGEPVIADFCGLAEERPSGWYNQPSITQCSERQTEDLRSFDNDAIRSTGVDSGKQRLPRTAVSFRFEVGSGDVDEDDLSVMVGIVKSSYIIPADRAASVVEEFKRVYICIHISSPYLQKFL